MNHLNLPAGFSCELYRQMNSDLSAFSDHELVRHYLTTGRYERRPYQPYLSNLIYEPVRQGGVNVLGFMNNILGLGETCRTLIKALHEAGIAYNLNELPIPKERYTFHETTLESRFDVNIICVNPDISYSSLDQRYFKGKKNIALIFWELEKLSDTWIDSLEMFDEIWVGSRFNEDTVRRHFPDKEVCRLPIAPAGIELQDKNECKERLGIGDDVFLCTFAYDSNSDFFRKNPKAVIRAFKAAFPEENCMLIIKTHQCPRTAFEFLKQEAGDDPRIAIWNEEVSEQLQQMLMNATDLYISLHRSEGLGLTMMEALLLGKPLVCTGYSGNLDFCREDWAELVRFELTEVQAQSHYASFCAPDSYWAEPDEKDAAARLRKIYDQYDVYAERALAGKRFIEENYDPQVLSSLIAYRLEKYVRPEIKP